MMMTIWNDLHRHHSTTATRPILALFDDPARADEFSARAGGFLFDYSKTNIDHAARTLLLRLAETAGVAARREAMFSGRHAASTRLRSSPRKA